MNDMTQLGLPTRDHAPAFRFDAHVLHEVDRRRSRRRQRRAAVVASAATVVVAIAAAITMHPVGGNGALEQEQRAGQVPTADGPPNQAWPQPESPWFGPANSATQVHGSDVPGRGTQTAPQPNATPRASSQQSGGQGGADSTPVRRDRMGFGDASCRSLLNGYAALGWCWLAADVTQLSRRHTASLWVALCRNGTDAGHVQFAKREQVTWSVSYGPSVYWTSSQQPSPFKAGETVTLQPQECLRWRVSWRVTTHGRPMPTGDYTFQWSNGADIRDASGNPYQESSTVHVGP